MFDRVVEYFEIDLPVQSQIFLDNSPEFLNGGR
jgi:hypothetical protein